MRRSLSVLASSCLLLLPGCGDPPPAEPSPPVAEADAPDVAAKFVGTWSLVGIERRTAGGQVTPTENPPIGFIMYDPAGYMGVVIMGRDRQAYAGDEPTPAEVVAAATSYTSYFGPFSVDEEAGIVTHHLLGGLNPGWSGSDFLRHYEFEDDRLTLQPPAGESGDTVHLTWERLPDLPDLTPEHRRFIGFWRFSEIERTDDLGEAVAVANGYDDGYIIYTASGHMAVHLIRPGREPYAEGAPTPEEALAALQTYGSYFGPYSIHAQEGYVVHHRIGTTNPSSMGSDAQRFYELSSDTLILKPPATTVDRRTIQSALTWTRLSE